MGSGAQAGAQAAARAGAWAGGNRQEGGEYPTTMRTFTDQQGRDWDVVAGRESWGSILAIFIPRERGTGTSDGDPSGIRQARLDATGYEEGGRELERCTERDLQALLDRSVPKETG